MDKIKSLGFILILLLGILILVIVRSTNQNLFKQNVQTVLDSSKDKGNIISLSQLENLKSKYHILDLNDTDEFNSSQFGSSINIPFAALLEKKNQKKLKETKDTIILYSENTATSSKAWVLLNQLGFKNVFILESEENSEVFKYKFQSDTVAELE